MSDDTRFLYLTRSEIGGLDIDYGDMIDGVETAFRAWTSGKAIAHPKVASLTDVGSFFYGLNACSSKLGYNICHNSMGVQAELARPGMHHLNGMQILSDYRTAQPLAAMDTFWASTWIPAAVSGLAARYFARPDSRVLGIIATGAQARVHVPALRAVLPIEKVVAYNRSRSGAGAFAAEFADSGIEIEITDDPRVAVEAADVLVTAVPVSANTKPILDPAWVRPGTWCSLVDLARSWHPGLESFELTATDDHDQAKHEVEIGRFKMTGPFDVDLRELVSSAKNVSPKPEDRRVICHSGHAIGILALAKLVYEAAQAKGVGTRLPANWS
jgi:ornithine cyclodeaminase/alanine dehydrogenase-like protein (mu-crystallin family)